MLKLLLHVVNCVDGVDYHCWCSVVFPSRQTWRELDKYQVRPAKILDLCFCSPFVTIINKGFPKNTGYITFSQGLNSI